METWKNIPGYRGKYQASTHGRIRSISRNIRDSLGRIRPMVGRIKKLQLGIHGYLTVSFGKNSQHQLVHRVILLTFRGRPKKNQASWHNDGSKINNKLNNLRWDTQSANLLDRIKHGTNTEGEHHWNSKLTKEQAKEIFDRSKFESLNSLATEFDLHTQTVYRISKKKRWKCLHDDIRV